MYRLCKVTKNKTNRNDEYIAAVRYNRSFLITPKRIKGESAIKGNQPDKYVIQK